MNRVLPTIVFLTGLAVLAIGGSVGFGGIKTLGFQIDPDFISVSKPDIFAIQDNHIRFLGGVFTVMGLMMTYSAFHLKAMRHALMTICCIIAIAGLFRFSSGLAFLTNMELLPSFILEIVYFPVLAWWIGKTS